MAQTSSAATFDYQAINLHMAKQLVKDLLEAFDAEGKRTRLARALVAAQEKTDALMLTVTPLAIDIAAEALSKWGIVEHEGDAFVKVMERISLLAPRDEELSFDVYQLKQKFLPVPPKELLEAEAKRVKEELRQQRRAAHLHHQPKFHITRRTIDRLKYIRIYIRDFTQKRRFLPRQARDPDQFPSPRHPAQW